MFSQGCCQPAGRSAGSFVGRGVPVTIDVGFSKLVHHDDHHARLHIEFGGQTYTFPEGPGFFIFNTLFQLIHIKIDREWLGPQIMPWVQKKGHSY